ncbi:MAG: DCC1-like thiol-disulfide oxidoreductase family protein [Thermodesulfobacteriota bacterium]|nr:DCC1-like thiol-disulfide oxidoreductase family protein [Thermodesulfobacteriota bacterium]
MDKKLYIDESCNICSNYASYMKSGEKCEIEIQDIKKLGKDFYLNNEMIFESEGKYFYGIDAVIKSMEARNNQSFLTKLLKILPNYIGKNLYKFIAKNRYKISKLFNVIKPES